VKTRVISGFVLIVAMMLLLFIGGPVLLAALFLLSLAGIYELCQTVGREMIQPDGTRQKLLHPFAYTAMIFALIWYLLLLLAKDQIWSGHLGMYFAAILVITCMTICIFTYPKRKFEDAAMTVFTVLYVPVLFSFIYLLREVKYGEFFVWYIILAAWGSDTMAYFTGMYLGAHRMAPKLSPKKTIEGAVGGVLGAVLICAIFGAIIADAVELDRGVLVKCSLLLGLVGSLGSMAGDLFASSIKRIMKIKDYSNLIPGHGGVLDRFDSILFVAPLMVMLLELFKVIA